MKNNYDILIIGGGPAGALAAKTAAEAGNTVCLIEKRAAIGTPVRCAEGIGKELLKEFIKPDPRWIAADIERARIISPNGTAISLEQDRAGNEVGYVLDRKIFDRELVWQAAEAGADVIVKTRATAPIMENGAVRGAKVLSVGIPADIRAEVVIAADGTEAQFARRAGLDTVVPLREMMSCAQYLMTDIDIDAGSTDFYLGNEIAPEGYLWVFPKGNRTANVGIGISGRKSRDGSRAKDYLDRFVAKNFPNGKTIEAIAGGVPVCRPLACTVADGLMVAGDAARVVDPITGGGIGNAMYTGRLAAQVASKCIAAGDCSKEALMPYDAEWRASKMGTVLERNYKVKEYFVTLDDAKLNTLAESIAQSSLKEFSVLGLIKELIKRNPKLLLELKALKDTLS
ncbi:MULTISPECIES: NAD(P)/FAD-dependent oxidoreductase [Methanoculleus]|uniref:Digeranylgeranylglycerophospholipid reductase n=2 Tax=Methanoculleus TaxID=45989 RepID=GGR_METMJ|nr:MULTISPECIES: NAD(P)/FAD-dependent oxidoreductase [Methanoculleus]A3CST9.1 RecName: Full=Digeranylgeranylglycerophospholipid reductase; Short=DGGGPL reductase; AltName: Full=2,3-bis-O-geranylgeranylglyceryl phosphate reductase; AltName: Full=Geranylgeranyl reductase; Short=GGR [Methanoculleus marisnigri JR1]ABN56439.1 2,3-di-O-geranylgeranylglyceryl phosphate reductase [Methanoculleus marisnigri JR1]UYU17884.1 NAD(P)/FAD-dependent oxidoreductase [Methanoculleus submarinus]